MNSRFIALIVLTILASFCTAAENTIIVMPDEPNSYLRPSENTQARHFAFAADELVAADEKAKAHILAEYFQKAAGFTPAIFTESKTPSGDLRKIHIGMTSFTKKRANDIKSLLDDGFIIDTTDPQNIIIAGPTSWGTEFGVYEFLERYLNIRWLLPGPDGEDVPKIKELNIPKERITQNPTFFSRLYSGIRGDGRLWARRNRMHSHISFHHNLANLFPVTKYAKTHPEFYPEIDGKRVVPAPGDNQWNICVSSQAIVDEAINNICQYFKEHPAAKSYSLGINDSTVQCKCEKCLALDTGTKTFINGDNLSDRYFTWANAVVEGVLKKYPDKYFGMLAYAQLLEPPTKVKIHERIIPYFCYDRYRWVKDTAAARQTDIRVTAQWAKVAPILGWYDYFYGTPYASPRVYFHTMAEYFRFARDNNVSAMYGEAYPNFGEGPKLYLALKMQWDVDADPDMLLNDWYNRCVGPKAAPHLKSYFNIWLDIWTTRIPNSDWWHDAGVVFMNFKLPGYLNAITSQDIAKADELMQKTVADAETGLQKKRAQALAKTFEYYKLTWQLYTDVQKCSNLAEPKTSAQAIKFLDKGTDMLVKATARRKMALEEFSNDPILVHSIDIHRFNEWGSLNSEYRGADWGSGWMWKAFGLAADGNEKVLAKLNALVKEHPIESVRKHAGFLTKIIEGELPTIDINGSFETGDKSRPYGYTFWVKGNRGKMLYNKEVTLEGEYSILFEGVARGAAIGTFPIEPGSYAIACSYYCPQKISKDAILTIYAKALGKNDRNLKQFNAIIIKPTDGKWAKAINRIEISQELDGPEKIQLNIQADKFEPKEKIYVDKLEIFKLN